jgi:hypothetical protein
MLTQCSGPFFGAYKCIVSTDMAEFQQKTDVDEHEHDYAVASTPNLHLRTSPL